jgi:ABC-type arginine transport system permease subunit
MHHIYPITKKLKTEMPCNIQHVQHFRCTVHFLPIHRYMQQMEGTLNIGLCGHFLILLATMCFAAFSVVTVQYTNCCMHSYVIVCCIRGMYDGYISWWILTIFHILQFKISRKEAQKHKSVRTNEIIMHQVDSSQYKEAYLPFSCPFW